MTIVAMLAIVIRAVVEIPRITTESSYARAAAQSSLMAKEAEAKGNLQSAASLREFAAQSLETTQANRPDPIGYACFVLLFTGGFLIVLVSLVIRIRRTIRPRLRKADAPSSLPDD
jgi:hypothetical protein